MDGFILRNASNLQMIIVLLTIILIVMTEAMVFYRLKLKKPFAILEHASKKISENNLDFSISYDSNDELGKLCGSFEKMRSSLMENNRCMWKSIEERKRLNAAFSVLLKVKFLFTVN